MRLSNYFYRLSEVQEKLSDYTVETLLECEKEIANIMLDAMGDNSLIDVSIEALWERRENLLLEIELKHNSIRG